MRKKNIKIVNVSLGFVHDKCLSYLNRSRALKRIDVYK